MKASRLVLATLLALGCVACTNEDSPGNNASTTNNGTSSTTSISDPFGDTPDTYFPRPEYDDPDPDVCMASDKTDAMHICTTTFLRAGDTSAEVMVSHFDRWGKLVWVESATPAEFEYDCDGKLIHALNGAPGDQVEIVNTYVAGLLMGMVTTNPDGSEDAATYTYDAQNRPQSVTKTTTEANGMTETETVTYEYDADGALLKETSSDGVVIDYWVDEDGVEWRGDRDGDGCKLGVLNDADGNWIEDHSDCDVFGSGHRVVHMKRDELGRPTEVALPDGTVSERYSYDGANPFPETGWHAYVDSSWGAETSNFEFSHTLTSLTISATNEATGEPAGTVTFDGVSCFPDELGLRHGWYPILAYFPQQ